MTEEEKVDARYIKLLVEPIKKCATYRPKFGTSGGAGVSFDQFRSIYAADPLYKWIGLDSPLMYAAHKAAGGMTSIYRQLGIGCERLLRQVIRDQLLLSEEQTVWEYKYEKSGAGDTYAGDESEVEEEEQVEDSEEGGLFDKEPVEEQEEAEKVKSSKVGVHKLDARILLSDIADHGRKSAVKGWIEGVAGELELTHERTQQLKGVVFEIRQGYKSADSKRQNADLRFGVRSYNENYLPVICIVSTQASETVCARYKAAQIMVLRGKRNGELEDTFKLFSGVLGYDLADFFERNSAVIRGEIEKILAHLLSADKDSSQAILQAVAKKE